jgi:hypothetical protein
MNIITNIISTTFDSVKRRLIKVRVLGLNDIRTAVEVSPFGIDSNPLKDMRAIYAETANKGDRVIIGYINKNQLAAVGEMRLFSTDAHGNLKTYIWIKNDATIEVGGNAHHMTQYEGLQTAFNQLKTDFNNLVTKFNSHVHTGVQTGGGSSAITPTPGTASTADITGAKIETVKTL